MGERTFSLQEALQAQLALRTAAGLEPERFPVPEFVGMISDEIEILRRQGRTDDEIAALISKESPVTISSADIAANYAQPEERNHGNRH